MDTNGTTELLPSPPSLMNALMAGFDAVTAHISLILLPLALDVFLWFGPQLRVGEVMKPFLAQLANFNAFPSPEQAADWADIVTGTTKFVTERFNLFSLLRTYPIGVPSLMSPRFPVETPLSMRWVFESGTGVSLALQVMGLLLAGFVLGSLYFNSVSQMTLSREKTWRSIVRALPATAQQVIVLAAFWLLLFVAIMVPASCVIGTLATGNSTVGRLGLFMFAGLLVWLAFPLVLSPHGIFVHRDSALASIRRGVRITRMTLPTTMLLFLLILLIGEGMDIIWNSTPDTSWLSLVGIAGHAFVTTALLAATFIYYKEADHWVQITLARLKLNSPNYKV